ELKVWDIASGEELFTRKTLALFSVAFSPDGKRLASASGDQVYTGEPGEIKMWEATSGQELITIKGHDNESWSEGFSPDGKRLASSSADTTVKPWDVGTGQELHHFEGDGEQVTSVAFSPDGQYLATGSGVAKRDIGFVAGKITLWDAARRTESGRIEGHTS